jgi:hypothetical protein
MSLLNWHQRNEICARFKASQTESSPLYPVLPLIETKTIAVALLDAYLTFQSARGQEAWKRYDIPPNGRSTGK